MLRALYLITSSRGSALGISQKNMKKAIVKFAAGYASRACRYFAWCVRAARERVETSVDGSVTLAEAFTESFAHLVFHLQGTSIRYEVPRSIHAANPASLPLNRYFLALWC